VIYAHKLLISEKWDRVKESNKSHVLEEALQK